FRIKAIVLGASAKSWAYPRLVIDGRCVELHVDRRPQEDRGRLRRQGAAPDAGAAARGAALSLCPQGLQRQRYAHHGGRWGHLYCAVGERGSVPCPGLRGPAACPARRDVFLRNRPADHGAITRKARGPACRRGADLVHLRRRRSHHAARSGARHLALGRMLGDRARAAAALRQRRAGGARPPPPSPTAPRRLPAPLRVAHGVSALALVMIFLTLHIANHLMFPAGEGTYDAVMKIFRHVYRNDILQPLVVALFLFQVGTGLFFVWRLTAAPSDRFRTFQIASGVYLAFYVLGHMDSVFIFARTYLGIDTGWDFATGAPTGLVKDPWNIRLVPHYWLGAFFVLAHLAAG